ncbi:MAG: CoB--CoM heterodisulfide reductase iron-sulfur subunit B family protein [Armatimonadota bacterium]
MKFAYYPGCSLHSTASEYDLSTRSVCSAMGIELEEIPDWNCCGASSAHAINHDLSIALPIRDLAKAEQMGMDVVAPCAACFSRLNSVNAAIKKDPELHDRINKEIGIEYKGSTNVLSLLAAIDKIDPDEIKSRVKKPLTGIKAASYYGCLLLRPPGIIKFDDPENPVSMDNIMTALGAEAVKWPFKTECCGAGLSLSKSDIVVKLTHDILSMAKRSGANCIVTACPLCQGNLDMRQSQVESTYGEKFDLPVFYFTQLMGLAFGLPASSLGLNKLMVNPGRLIAEAGLKDE